MLGHPNEIDPDDVRSTAVAGLQQRGKKRAARALASCQLQIHTTDSWSWHDDYIYELHVSIAGGARAYRSLHRRLDAVVPQVVAALGAVAARSAVPVSDVSVGLERAAEAEA